MKDAKNLKACVKLFRDHISSDETSPICCFLSCGLHNHNLIVKEPKMKHGSVTRVEDSIISLKYIATFNHMIKGRAK
jgi:hypothetical protein